MRTPRLRSGCGSQAGYCPEQKPRPPRVVVSGIFQPRNLDDELRRAQIGTPTPRLSERTPRNTSVKPKAAVACWDEAHK